VVILLKSRVFSRFEDWNSLQQPLKTQ